MIKNNTKNHIENLIYLFSKLPGLGPRSARRIALHILKEKDTRIDNFINVMKEVKENTYCCEVCNNIDISSPCNICLSNVRDDSIIAIVEDVADLWAIERSGSFRGKYHILGGTLSAMKGKSPQFLGLEILRHRISSYNVQELIIATSSTLDGQTTAYFILDYFKDCGVKFSRLASGIPIGGEIDYLDEGTLSAAMSLRQPF